MRVSICIPTYNRAPQLRRLLDSIAQQNGHALDFEIAISDNASTDDTPALIENYVGKGLPIVYRRLDTNRGFDRNILNAVDIASGDYCWLFGSDDLVEPGAFAKIEQVLAVFAASAQSMAELPAGISVGSQGYNADLTRHIFVDDHISTEFATDTILRGRDQTIGTIGPWLGFISSMIVRRDRWRAVVAGTDLSPYFKGYIHTYLVARMLDAHSTWLCVPDRLVGCRTGNESFQASNEFARTRLDIVGYDLAFGDTLGRDNLAYRRAMAKVATFYIRTHFLGAKLHGVSNAYWKQAIPMSVSYYWRYPMFWIRTFPISIMPRFILLTAQALYRRTIKPNREVVLDK